MLFRADFVRQKHVPGSIETNHGSLSKIIGNCWRALPLEDKKIWEQRAKVAKAEHKARYPNYRFRPVHNKNKDKKKEKQPATREEERRCEKVAQLLLEGKKGDELVAAFKEEAAFDNSSLAVPVPQRHRRSSSVPLPNDYYQPYTDLFIPSLAQHFNYSRPPSPLSRQQRMIMGQRRASSAAPMINRGWALPMAPTQLQQDHEPLPEPDTSLFEPFSFNQSNGTGFSMASQYDPTQTLTRS
uniref:STE11 protein n=1 Tax=Volvariella volvacea TaxID=36659 RepID=R9WW88_9AGAR|nr:STE11 protein [Volvariella volvacea]